MSKAVARALAGRCRELQAHGLDKAAAERLAFEEFLGDPQHRVAACGAPNLYQDFLQAYAPEQRRTHGVYYTPGPVVAAQVRMAADLLEQRLGCRAAFGDERVLTVDPAAGSGAYPLAVFADTQARAPRATETLARRMRLFEPLAGAASLARAQGLDVEECDVLAAPIAFDAPILVCLGNPPYRRTQRHAAPAACRADARLPGEGVHLKNTYNEYVYFWRWAMRTVFEQRSGPGIVSFISASSFVRGPGFGGLRQMLRRALDELWIIDLEGDHLAARRTANVFPIRTPVAIAVGVRYADTSSTAPARTHYARLTGSREAKLAELDNLRRMTDLTWQSSLEESAANVSNGVRRPGGHWSTPFVPRPRSAYQGWPLLTELFPWQVSGAQVKRTWPIGPTAEVLRARWAQLLACSGDERRRAFRETRDRDLDSTPRGLCDPAGRQLAPLRALAAGAACIEPVRYAYRSFDRQWLLPDARLGDFMRPALWRVAGPRQIYLTSLLTNVLGPGPAAVATALVPDLDHFRGSFGARAVIPLWLDAAATQPNVARSRLDCLATRYGVSVDAKMLLAYCYALLGTRSYVQRFEEELRTPGPRLPFPRDPDLFLRAADLGRRLLALQTFRSVPIGVAQEIESAGSAYPTAFGYESAQATLRLGDGLFGPVGPAVWAYSVSGLRIVPAWLRRRISRTQPGKSPLDGIGPRRWTPTLTRELLEVVWVLEATLALEPALDAVLAEIVSGGGDALAGQRGE